MDIKEKLSKNKKKTKVIISFRLERENVEFLKKLRDEENIVMSNLIDSLIEDFKKECEKN